MIDRFFRLVDYFVIEHPLVMSAGAFVLLIALAVLRTMGGH